MLQHCSRQLQQPHVIRNRLPRHSHPLPNLLLGQSKISAQLGKRRRLLDAVQVLPLQVLDDSHLRRLLVGNASHHRRNRRLPRQLRRPATPLAQNQRVSPVRAGTHHHRLNHPVGPNRIRQLLQEPGRRSDSGSGKGSRQSVQSKSEPPHRTALPRVARAPRPRRPLQPRRELTGTGATTRGPPGNNDSNPRPKPSSSPEQPSPPQSQLSPLSLSYVLDPRPASPLPTCGSRLRLSCRAKARLAVTRRSYIDDISISNIDDYRSTKPSCPSPPPAPAPPPAGNAR